MKQLKKIKQFFFFLLLTFSLQNISAQSREELLAGSGEVTWLGMDFSATKFIGSANQFKDAGEITNTSFKEKYVVGWNQLFIDEEKRYDIAKVVHRSGVKYAIDVAGKANAGIKADFFSNDPNEYTHLDEEKIADKVKRYNYQGKTGIGLIFFIEGMSKGKNEAVAWITYVDMKSKTVLLTARKSARAGGIGFKNYWAKSFLGLLKAADYKRW